MKNFWGGICGKCLTALPVLFFFAVCSCGGDDFLSGDGNGVVTPPSGEVDPQPDGPKADVTEGLYAYYTFEDNSDNTVEGAPDAILAGSPEYGTGLGNTKGLGLKAADALNVTEAMIDGCTFTVSFWVKGIPEDGHIFHVNSSGQYAVSHVLSVKGGFLNYQQFGYNFIHQYNNVNYCPAFLHSSLKDDKWHHVVMTSSFDTPGGIGRTDLALYVDGRVADNINDQQNSDTQTVGRGTRFVLGGPVDTHVQDLEGIVMTVDNLRIYNERALSADEVRTVYEKER